MTLEAAREKKISVAGQREPLAVVHSNAIDSLRSAPVHASSPAPSRDDMNVESFR